MHILILKWGGKEDQVLIFMNKEQVLPRIDDELIYEVNKNMNKIYGSMCFACIAVI